MLKSRHSRRFFFPDSEEQGGGAASSSSAATSAPQDNRVIFSDDQRMRRYDSIARLFAMDSKYSACAAVSILDKQLIIASNSASARRSQQVASFLNERLMIIRDFLRSAREEKPSFTEDSPEILSVIQRLKAQGGLLKEIGDGKKDDIQRLTQALYKLSYTVQNLDDEPFSKEEVKALLDSDQVTYLVPAEREGEEVYEPFMGLYRLNGTDISEAPDEQIDFIGSDLTREVNKFHAEQLIAYYIIHAFSLVDTATLPIGISMLACATCQKLNSPQFKLRGTSRTPFHDTANLLDYSIFSTESYQSPVQGKAGLLQAEPSPFDSKNRKRAKLEFNDTQEGAAAAEVEPTEAPEDSKEDVTDFSGYDSP
jgi:hypothetical protein